MKKIVFLLITLIGVFSCSSTSITNEKQRYGRYYPMVKTFEYDKNNLIWPDKQYSYFVVDNTGLLENIVDVVSNKYSVPESDYILIDTLGVVDGDTLNITKILNYSPQKEYLEN